MSVFPVPVNPVEPGSPAPPLRLVTHEHVWELRSVEYDETFEVRCYECSGCDDVMYR